MPRSAAVAVENSFVNGLVTEVTGLNTPENACLETYNCVFDHTGRVSRRLGFDFEAAYTTATITRTDAVIVTYLWKDVSGDGNTSFLVVQIGGTLYFYTVGGDNESLSANKHSDSLALSTFASSSAAATAANECQFSQGNGYLFVTHPFLDSFYVSFDAASDNFTATEITINIRDFEGEVQDDEDIDERPAALDAFHNYNLLNQGWNAASLSLWTNFSLSTNGTMVSGSKTVTAISASDTTKLAAGMAVSGTSIAASTRVETMLPPPAGATTVTTLRLDTAATGSTTNAIVFTMGNHPSNSDVWWVFKDSTDTFNLATIDDLTRGNTPAPKGHYILSLYSQARTTISGLAGLTDLTISTERVSTGAFFAGRVWYSGLAYKAYNSKIFFSPVIERVAQFGQCYQQNDPTSEDLFDILPTDGGVIDIPEAGTILKLVPVDTSLLVFANNGIWSITGSTGIGFTANDYTIRKISTINAISATNFVDVAGYPAWWNIEGIYIIAPDQQGAMGVRPLSDPKIRTFFQEIPAGSRRQARGYFNLIDKTIQWLYRSEEAGDINDRYEYDSVLNFNVVTGAFYPWTIGASDVKVAAISLLEGGGGSVSVDQVVAGADTVIDASSNNVVVFNVTGTLLTPSFKYLVTYNDGSDKFTFAETRDEDYGDWDTYGTIVDYESYFVTGYRIRGDAQRKFQPTYVYLFCDNTTPSTLKFRGIWNYAISGDTGKWSNYQTLTMSDADLWRVKWKRIKVRGHGIVLQFKVLSVTGEPFDIDGWSIYETGNQGP